MITSDNFKSAFEALPNGYVILRADSPAFTIEYVNAAFSKMAGVVSKDIIGKGLFEAFAENPEDTEAKRRKKNISTSLEYVKLFNKEHKIRLHRYNRKNKDTNSFAPRFWNWDNFPVVNEKGEVTHIVQCLTDVTEMLDAEREASALENNRLTRGLSLHPVFAEYPDAIFTLDLKGNFLSVNKVMVQIAECGLNDLLKMSFVKFIPTKNLYIVFRYFQRAIKGEHLQFETPVVTATGQERYVHVTALPISIHNEIVGLNVIAKDISMVVNTTKELAIERERTSRYNDQINNLLERITDGFFAIDNHGIVNYWNKQAEDTFQVKKDNILGRNFYHSLPGKIPRTRYSGI